MVRPKEVIERNIHAHDKDMTWQLEELRADERNCSRNRPLRNGQRSAKSNRLGMLIREDKGK